MRIYVLLFGLVLLLFSCAKPMAKFQAVIQNDEVPAEVEFLNESENSEEYQWDFGDGNTSKLKSPKHKYTKSGRYNITLMVKKGNKSDQSSEELFFNAPEECLVKIETTAGTMVVKLSDDTPLHRDNFVKLVKEDFYKDILFHRVIQNFMVQGGDPNSKGADNSVSLGSGGPGYKVDAEFVEGLYHVRGALAAARQGDQVNPEKRSSGSQFYIVHGNKVNEELLNRIEAQKGFLYPEETRKKYLADGGTPFLDKDYTVFGVLVEGFDVLEKIAQSDTDRRDRPTEDIRIISTEIVK